LNFGPLFTWATSVSATTAPSSAGPPRKGRLPPIIETAVGVIALVIVTTIIAIIRIPLALIVEIPLREKTVIIKIL